EQVDRLKRPFTRGDPSRSGAAGAGLGLAIVERIARLHGARFDVLAREGGGTLARVTMPAGAGLQGAGPSRTGRARPSRRCLRRIRCNRDVRWTLNPVRRGPG